MDNRGQFKKGTSGNLKGRPKKAAKGEILALHVGNKVPPPPEEKRVGDINTRDYEPFGSNNLFPQELVKLTKQSPLHRGILNSKVIYVTGKGFESDNDALLDHFREVNPTENLRQVYSKLLRDFYEFGNAYMEIVTDSSRTFMNWFHKDSTTCRVIKGGGSVIIHPNWAKFNTTKEKGVTIPLYPEFKEIDGGLRSIFQFKRYEPEFNFYGLPDWVAAMDAAGIGYKTNKWNLSRLDNSFQTSGVLLVNGQMDEDNAKKLKTAFRDEFLGEGNTGKILFLAQNLGEKGSTTYTPISTDSEGDWIELHKQSGADLIIAHNWYKSLIGMSDSTGFDTQRIRNEWQVALATIIENDQMFFTEVFTKITEKEIKLSGELSVINKSPVNLLDLINVDKVMKIRQAIGLIEALESDYKDEELDQFIDSSNTTLDGAVNQMIQNANNSE